MLDFKTKDEGTWFYFIEDRSESVCLRMPTADEYEDIQRLTVKPGKPEYHRGHRYETEKTDDKLSERLSLRKFIMDWKGIGLDGTEIECTNENKEKMMKITDFRMFVGECIEKMVEENKTIEEARAKNLNDSLDGDSAKEEDSAETNAQNYI